MSEKYFITGATGLVGAALIEHLSEDDTAEVIAYVRDEAKAQKMFSHLGRVSILAGSLEQPIDYDGDIDYIIHGAAPTDSTFFMQHPVETIDSIVLGAKNVLELAKEKDVKSVVNLSSMEVYGTPTQEEDLTEDKQYYLDPANIRSNYPLAKRLVENMCAAYSAEYGVPVSSARLAQVIGKELLPGDNRVIAQFIRAAQNKTDIEIATTGETKQTYVSIDDTIDGIMTLLDKAEPGESYNIANESTYRSIREMAEIVAHELANDEITVTTNTANTNGKYPPDRTLRINSSKLRSLGWVPQTSLDESLKGLMKQTGRV